MSAECILLGRQIVEQRHGLFWNRISVHGNSFVSAFLRAFFLRDHLSYPDNTRTGGGDKRDVRVLILAKGKSRSEIKRLSSRDTRPPPDRHDAGERAGTSPRHSSSPQQQGRAVVNERHRPDAEE